LTLIHRSIVQIPFNSRVSTFGIIETRNKNRVFISIKLGAVNTSGGVTISVFPRYIEVNVDDIAGLGALAGGPP
jgi:hypothetical protein